MAEEKEKMRRVFAMTPEVATVFFWLVRYNTDHGIEDSAALRNYILNWLAKEDQMKFMYDTKRTEDEIVSDYNKMGFNIQDERKKNKED